MVIFDVKFPILDFSRSAMCSKATKMISVVNCMNNIMVLIVFTELAYK